MKKVTENVLGKKIFNLYRKLMFSKKEYVMSKRLLIAGTGLTCGIEALKNSVSLAEKIKNTEITIKKAAETGKWLKLLYENGYIDSNQFKSFESETEKILESIKEPEIVN